MNDPRFLSGQLLLALPGIGDARFERAVIAMCVHDEDGALGIGLGQVYEGMSVRALMEGIEIDPGTTPADAQVHIGGPVEPARGFVLHSPDYAAQGTLNVGDQWALSANLDILKAIAAGCGPARWIMALGYAGWGEGQLDEELLRHGWLTAAGSDAIVFDTPADQRWPRAFAGLGVDVAHLAAAAGRA
jgi:putative transcriptional regulator